MKQYLDLLKLIKEQGVSKEDRTGTGTRSIFGPQMRFNLADGFPILTTKKVHLKSIIHELLWFLSGDTKIKYLKDNKVRIWDEWATEKQCAKFGREAGDLGPIYGHQWRNFGAELQPGYASVRDGKVVEHSSKYRKDGVDQISRAIELLKNNPDSRRILVTGWNPKESDKVALPPCHTMFQFYVADNKLSCKLYQRSADVFLGVPFNICSYALLTMMVAQVCDLELGDFIHTFGDVHIYNDHFTQVDTQLSREPRELPKMVINPDVKDIFSFKYEDFKLEGYKPHPRIKAKVSV